MGLGEEMGRWNHEQRHEVQPAKVSRARGRMTESVFPDPAALAMNTLLAIVPQAALRMSSAFSEVAPLNHTSGACFSPTAVAWSGAASTYDYEWPNSFGHSKAAAHSSRCLVYAVHRLSHNRNAEATERQSLEPISVACS